MRAKFFNLPLMNEDITAKIHRWNETGSKSIGNYEITWSKMMIRAVSLNEWNKREVFSHLEPYRPAHRHLSSEG